MHRNKIPQELTNEISKLFNLFNIPKKSVRYSSDDYRFGNVNEYYNCDNATFFDSRNFAHTIFNNKEASGNKQFGNTCISIGQNRLGLLFESITNQQLIYERYFEIFNGETYEHITLCVWNYQNKFVFLTNYLYECEYHNNCIYLIDVVDEPHEFVEKIIKKPDLFDMFTNDDFDFVNKIKENFNL
jgi:hypothetical protein